MVESLVENPLPAPNNCDVCCSLNVEFTTNNVIYGRQYGDWPYIYFCTDCGASVGCHNKTKIPLGRMADRATKKLRKKAHDEFDQLWQRGFMSRDKAYKWLGLQLEIDNPEDCHISLMTKEQLKKTAELSKKYLNENAKALIKRRKKQDGRANKRNERNHSFEQYKRGERSKR